MDNNSLELYLKLMKFFQRVTIVLGHDIYRVDFKIGIRTIFTNVLVVCEFFSITITALNSLEHLPTALQAISTVALPIMNMVKFGTLLYYRKELYQLHEFVIEMLQKRQGQSNQTFYTWMHRTHMVAKLQATMYFATAIGAFSFPVIYYCVFHEKGYIALCFLPYFDRVSRLGYTLNTIYQAVLGLITVLALYAVDLLFILMLFTGSAYIDFVRLDCDALTAELMKTGKQRNEQRVTQLLRAIFVRGQEMDSFLNRVYSLFEKGACIQIYSTAFSLAVLVVVANITDWFPAYMFSGCFMYIIMIYSLLGTVVEAKTEELCDYVYSIPWHELSQKNKRMYLILLHHLQRPVGLHLFGSVCLNVATGSSIFKIIYQGFMLIRDYL